MMLAIRTPFAARRHAAGRTRAISGKPASPLVLRYPVTGGDLYVGIDGAPQLKRPGNGGLRIWKYKSSEDAIAEAAILASTMTSKHDVYNTGFSGAKLVLDAEDPSDIDKEKLMREVSNVLRELDGTVYTGCDINTSMDDMTYLSSISPFVLASIGCPTDTNVATGHSTFAAIQAYLDAKHGGCKGATVLVKGTGKVGTTVAELLVQEGANVLTLDVVADRANIPGCTNVSDRDWRAIRCDVLCPCSTSRFIDVETASALDVQAVIGSSNAPFDGEASQAALEDRGVFYIPESVSSAGAVLADSIECFDAEAYADARPAVTYAFIRDLVYRKTQQLLTAQAVLGKATSQRIPDVVTSASTKPVGSGFSTWVSDRTEEYDVVVIGGGMAGTAAAYQLSKQAPHLKGLVVESRTVAHKGGSSFGQGRMFRQMYSDSFYSKLQTEALKLWEVLEQDCGEQLLDRNGLLFYGDTDTGETVEGSVKGAAQTMQRLDIPHTYFGDAAQLQERWDLMKPNEAFEGVYEATAGSVNPSASCAAMMRLAMDSGSWSLRENAAVDDIDVAAPGSARVLLRDGRFIKAKRVVLCAGAWTNKLLAHLGYRMDLEVHSVAWGHWQVPEATAQQMPQWFCFKKSDGGAGADSWDGGLYYGFPAADGKIRVGIDFTPDAPGFKHESMDTFDYDAHPRINKLIGDFIEQNWQGFGSQVDMQASPYAMTRDTDFVLDTLPDHPEVVVFTGGSGRAFKFAPLLGRCLADLASGQPPAYDVSRFSVTRKSAGLQRVSNEAECTPAVRRKKQQGVR